MSGRPGESRYAILAALHRLGGSVENKSGRASGLVKKEAGLTITPAGFASHLAVLEKEGLIVREVKGKRTYAIVLCDLPDAVRSEVIAINARWHAQHKPPEPEPQPEAEIASAPVSDVDYRLLADVLLDAVVHKATEDPSAETLSNLSKALEHGDALRSRVRELEAKIEQLTAENLAKGRELTGLRDRLAQAERNLQAAAAGNNVVVDEEVAKRLGRFMEQRPGRGWDRTRRATAS